MAGIQKIRNATPTEYNNIKFKSKLEVMAYKTLLSEGLSPVYEGEKVLLIKGLKPTVPFYNYNKGLCSLTEDLNKLRDITYTPDFKIVYKDCIAYIEMKSIENDVFPIKKKLFRMILEKRKKLDPNIVFLYFELRNKKQVLECIKVIKDYG